jgi:uncharacterized Zn-binding protein involved in type VI secretion
MKRAIFLATAALLVMLVLAPVAMAQDTAMKAGGQTAMKAGGQTVMAGGKTAAIAGGQTAMGAGGQPLPGSGGPAILLPAAALLLGSGVLTYAILRRR